ncbi:hypothetical protein B0H13DRAFT_2284788 [Mycena leptocephala]|nr:hypothetical protein B0H13DRAFT_2284788 [Mycena leptocephala]
MGRCVSCPRRTARPLSESEIGQGGLGRAYSEEEEGVKGKKEEEVQRFGEIVNKEDRICMYEDWTDSVWWYGSGETLRAEGAEPDWLVFRTLKSVDKPDVNSGPQPAELNVYPFKSCRFETLSFCNKTGRVALRERESERGGGEWYHAASVGIEETFVFPHRLFGWIVCWSPPTAQRSFPSATPPRRLRPSSSGPGSPQGPMRRNTATQTDRAWRRRAYASDWHEDRGDRDGNANGNGEGGKKRRGEPAASGEILDMHPVCYDGVCISAYVATAHRFRPTPARFTGSRTRRWILHREPRTTPTDVIHLCCLTERSEAARIVWSFRPWMDKSVVALCIHDEWVQGSVLSTSDATPVICMQSTQPEHRAKRAIHPFIHSSSCIATE